MLCLGIEPAVRTIVCPDESTELWRLPSIDIVCYTKINSNILELLK